MNPIKKKFFSEKSLIKVHKLIIKLKDELKDVNLCHKCLFLYKLKYDLVWLSSYLKQTAYVSDERVNY